MESIENMKDITVDEYCDLFIPQAGFALILKDNAAKKIGGLFVPKSTRQLMEKWNGTGILKVLSPFPGESEHDKMLHEIYKVEDRVTFNVNSPIDLPKPPFLRFKATTTGDEVGLILIHIADLLGIIADDKDHAENIRRRA